MRSRVEWKYIFRIMREFSKNCKWVCSKSFVLGVFGAVTPYISIVLMGYLLDAVKAGAAVDTLLKYAGVSLGAVMVIKLAEAFIRESFNAKNEFIKELEARALNEKSLRMDYEYLEDTTVQARGLLSAFCHCFSGFQGIFLQGGRECCCRRECG